LLTPKHDQPWFMYLGMIDTHVTLRPKEPWISKYDANYTGKYKQYGDDGTGVPKGLSDKDKDHVRAIYDSNVSYQDDLVGQLLAQLDKWGIADQTMIILTADHGDEHWEDGRFGHGGSIRETLQHVPLVIHYPPMFPTAKIDIGTEGIDIVPTIADALGVAVDPEWQGTSLIPLANGQIVYPQMSFGSRYESGHGGRIGHWKVALSGAAQPKVYDFSKDKDEQKDIYDSAHIGERLLLDPMWMLRQWAVEWKKSQWGNAANVSSRFAADLGE
ncbi:MAG TPA: sulfatase-like hydrolase/transferase, partial [Kofleriaceae bacterium]